MYSDNVKAIALLFLLREECLGARQNKEAHLLWVGTQSLRLLLGETELEQVDGWVRQSGIRPWNSSGVDFWQSILDQIDDLDDTPKE